MATSPAGPVPAGSADLRRWLRRRSDTGGCAVATYSYATVDDYEKRIGYDIPDAEEPTVQQHLDDTSTLIALYLGDCEPEVVAAYPDVLTILTCSIVYRQQSVPVGVRSESIGATSVSYADTEAGYGKLMPGDEELLDDLIAKVCVDDMPTHVPGLGAVGVTWAGYSDPAKHWARDVDCWVM